MFEYRAHKKGEDLSSPFLGVYADRRCRTAVTSKKPPTKTTAPMREDCQMRFPGMGMFWRRCCHARLMGLRVLALPKISCRRISGAS